MITRDGIVPDGKNFLRRDGYPYCVVYNKRRTFLVWVDGRTEKDYFLTLENGWIHTWNSLECIRENIDSQCGITLHAGDSAFIDLDRFFDVVGRLSEKVVPRAKTCSCLLEGWNFLEDIEVTLKISPDLSLIADKRLEDLYQKIYCGNNLPSVTPKGAEYRPIFTETELRVFKSAIKEGWKFILKKSPNLVSAQLGMA